MSPTLFWTIAVVVAVLMAVRLAFRFRNQFAAIQEARQIGIIKCRRCGFHGPVLGWATFFGFKKLVCPKCRGTEWDRSPKQPQSPPSQT